MAKRVDLSLSEKVKLVPELELPGVTQASAVRKYGISTSQVSRLSKKKDDLVRGFESGSNRSRKRKREGKEEDVGRKCSVSVVRAETRPRCASFRAALETEGL